MIRRMIAFLQSIMLTVFVLAGAAVPAGAQEAGAGQQRLYEQGLEAVSNMMELVNSEEYRQLLGADVESLDEVLETLRSGNYDAPERVYKITFLQDPVELLCAMSEVDADSLSGYVEWSLKKRMVSNFASQLNAQYGVAYVTAQAIYNGGGVPFLDEEFGEDQIYLYAYEDGFPVIVTFSGNENGIVSSSANFWFQEEFAADSPEAVKEQLEKVWYLGDFEVESIMGA